MSDVAFRSARPTDDLEALRRFYVDGIGCELIARFEDHAGFDGLILGRAGGTWQIEFVHEHGVCAGRATSEEQLFVFYVDDEPTLQAICARLCALDAFECAPHNPYWGTCGRCFVDPDGYVTIVALRPPRRLTAASDAR